MYSNSYQNGTYIELYNAQKKESQRKCKITGPVISEFDQSLKGHVLTLINGGISKIQLPKSDKNLLGIVQTYIVIQIYFYSLKSFGLEISFSDIAKIHRRILFSTSIKELVVNPLHCKVPFSNTLSSGKWHNISFDITSFSTECFKNQSLRSIDIISLTGNCRIRKIFSMKSPFPENGSDFKSTLFQSNNFNSITDIEKESLNKLLSLCNEVPCENVNFNFDKIKVLHGSNSFADNNPNSPQLKSKNSNLLNNNFIDGNIISPYMKQILLKNNTPIKDKAPNNIINKLIVPNTKLQVPKIKTLKAISKKTDQNTLSSNEVNQMRSKSKSPDKNTSQPNVKRPLPIKTNILNINNNLRSSNINLKVLKTNNIEVIKNNPTKLNKADSFINNLPKIIFEEQIEIKHETKIKDNLINIEINKAQSNKDEQKEEEEQYKFDEKDFSTKNSHEEKLKMNDFQPDLEDNIDEKISIMSENSERNEDFKYCDIPVRDIVKNNKFNQIKKDTIYNQNTNNHFNYNPQSWRHIDNTFTPPFENLKQLKLNFKMKAIEKNNQDDFIGLDNKKTRFLNKKDEQLLDLIYDHVLGCYYDPNTEIYYELKEK